MSHRFRWVVLLIAISLMVGSLGVPAHAQIANPINHIIVLYMENWSFDALYGMFPGADGQQNAAKAAPQVDKTGKVYDVLPAPLNSNKKDSNGKYTVDDRFKANLPNKPYELDTFVPMTDLTGDLVHRFYQEQLQIDGGKMDKYVAWSDAAGLVMGYEDTTKLPMFKYAQQYTIGDHFFHGAFGGSFLNHIYLICTCAPTWPNAPADIVAQVDSSGAMTKDGQVTPDGFVVNTSFASASPHPSTVKPDHLVPPQTMPTIGDRLSDKNITWAWYSGGWNDAIAGNPDKLFQFHHQAFAFFKNYGDGTDGRKQHLKDDKDFFAAVADGSLPAVSFVKPIGKDNEHPGYTTVDAGEKYAAALVDAVQKSPVWKDTAIIITYDENGGQYDHVAPPTTDKWGPGTRVPLLVISPFAKKGFIDHTQMDTSSILKFIETRYGLQPLSDRDKNAADMMTSFDLTQTSPGSAATMAATAGG